jgi:hypothetical protein
MRIIAAAIALVLFCGPAVALDSSKSNYEDLVARAEAGDTALDYTALRMAYARTDNYDPYAKEIRPLYTVAVVMSGKNDCITATAAARQVLKIDYTFIQMHLLVGDCLKTFGDGRGAAREAAIAQGLSASLLASGDGKSLQTAYVVVTLAEESFVLVPLGITKQRHTAVGGDGHFYDRVAGVDKITSEPREVFFTADVILAGTARLMNKPPSGSHP